MLCEICNKNQATIHIQEIINGQKKALHICADCAAEKTEENPVLQGVNLAEMLYNLSEQISTPEDSEAKEGIEEKISSVNLVCPECKWDTSKFRKTGRLGCANCYHTFRDILNTALKNMHKGSLHVGKQPGQHNTDETGKTMMEIMNLQKELEELIQREEYEKAAVVRDKINFLKEEQGKEK